LPEPRGFDLGELGSGGSPCEVVDSGKLGWKGKSGGGVDMRSARGGVGFIEEQGTYAVLLEVVTQLEQSNVGEALVAVENSVSASCLLAVGALPKGGNGARGHRCLVATAGGSRWLIDE
jgi:hypothetical protein